MPAAPQCSPPVFGHHLPLGINPLPHSIATGAGVPITMIDTGAGNPGITGDRDSCILHGTAVASVLATVAPGARIHSIRHSPRIDAAEGTVAELSSAVIKAITPDPSIPMPKILNISMVTCEDSPLLREAIARAQQAGVLVIVSAGNKGQCEDTQPPYPASLPGVLAVGALTEAVATAPPQLDSAEVGAKLEGLELDNTMVAAAERGATGSTNTRAAAEGTVDKQDVDQLNAGRTMAPYSAPGPWAAIYAPGGPISATLSTPEGQRTITGGPQPFVGTSFATPIVSGTAALVWQITPYLSAQAVAHILHTTASPGGAVPGSADPLLVVNPQAAVELALKVRTEWEQAENNGTNTQAEPLSRENQALSKAEQTAQQPPAIAHTITAHTIPPHSTDYSVAIALPAVVALVLILAAIARALASESKPASGRAETTRQETRVVSVKPRA